LSVGLRLLFASAAKAMRRFSTAQADHQLAPRASVHARLPMRNEVPGLRTGGTSRIAKLI